MTFSDNNSECIRTITLNGKTGPSKIARPMIQALNDPRIITEKAGFLFKAAARENHLHLAVVPTLINGERNHHYDHQLQDEDAFTLIGDINATGDFTILFKPEQRQMSPEQKEHYLRNYRTFAQWLLDQGYTGKGTLSDVTQMILPEIGLDPVPATLAELAAL
jgi:hypothetical protein